MKKLLYAIVVFTAIASYARSQKSIDIAYGEMVQLKSAPEFVETGRWTLGLESIYEHLDTSHYTTNEYGMILAWKTSANELSSYKLKKHAMDPIDGCDNLPLQYEWTAITPDDINLTIQSDGTVKANKEGSVSIKATDGKYTLTKTIAFNNFSAGKSLAFWCGNVRNFENELFTEWYSYVTNRDINNIKTINGGYNACGGLCCGNDYVWSNKDYRYYMGTSYNSELYVPVRAVSFRLLSAGNAIRNSGNCIGSKVSVNCFHYGDLPRQADIKCNYTHNWMKPDGTKGTVHSSKASALQEWARAKGIYSDEEVSAIGDVLVYVYDTEVPEECQAGILKSTTEDAAPSIENSINLYKSPGFCINQHGLIQPQYISSCYKTASSRYSGSLISSGSANIEWQDMNNVDNIAYRAISGYRHDDVDYGSIYPYHTAHVCDSGRPIFWIYKGEPILEFCHLSASGGPSCSHAWRILRDFCKEVGSTINLWDATTGTKTVVQP